MTVNNIPGEAPVCWCGLPHRPENHRNAFDLLVSKCDRVLAEYDVHALDTEIRFGLGLDPR